MIRSIEIVTLLPYLLFILPELISNIHHTTNYHWKLNHA